MIWLDAHLSPRIAKFLSEKLGIQAIAIRDLSLHTAEDTSIYQAAADAGAVFITKDKDFADLSGRLGAPPAIVLLTCGNTTEARLQEIFTAHLPDVLQLIGDGEPLVEISGK
jgi:predicted nuclease of predicted toxin-antitoxin system